MSRLRCLSAGLVLTACFFLGSAAARAASVPGPGPSVQEVLDLISAATAVYPPGTWLFATVGTAFSEDPQAQRLTLDQVAPNHPVKLELWTGHGMYFNTRGLTTLHISEHAADPFGGFYERFPGTNTLNGVVHEYAEHQVRRQFAQQLSDAQIAAIYQDFIQRALRLGFTSVQDMSIGLPQARGIEILDRLNPPLRWREICFPLTPQEACSSGHTTAPLVTASGIKWIGDGTPIERLAFVTEPYADFFPTTHGRFNFPANAFRSMLERGLHGPKKENQLLFHLVGDAAIGTLIVDRALGFVLDEPGLLHGAGDADDGECIGIVSLLGTLEDTLADRSASRPVPAREVLVDHADPFGAAGIGGRQETSLPQCKAQGREKACTPGWWPISSPSLSVNARRAALSG